MSSKSIAVAFALSLNGALAQSAPRPTNSWNNVDVAIIGGGAAGTYAAIRLSEDYDIEVSLIEKNWRLGGSVSTYTVEGTNTTLEYGVQSYMPNDAANGFFKRFNIPTTQWTSTRLTPINVDIATGEELEGYIAPNINATNEAFQRWVAIVNKYAKYTEPGYWDFPLPEDIPEDLLTPFVEFVKANDLDAAVPRIIGISGTGNGGMGELLTLSVIRAFGALLTNDFIANSLIRPEGSNSRLYEAAKSALGSDIIPSAHAETVTRTADGGFQIIVNQGLADHVVVARRVLFAAPPSLENLKPFDMDEKQLRVFDQLDGDGEYIGVAKIPCIPHGTQINFMSKDIVPTNYVNQKNYPHSLRVDSTGPEGANLFRVMFAANYTLSAEEYMSLVREDIRKAQDQGVVPTCDIEFKATSDHTRPQWKQTAEEIKAGFVQDLYDLQGYRDIWFAGYAWSAPYSSTVWAFVDTLLPKLVADLKKDGKCQKLEACQ